MRALLTGGIKAILGIAALSTAAHWTLRVQRESTPASPIAAFASLPDPAATGSIEPRRPVSAPAVVPAPVAMPAPGAGLDQGHLAALIAGATPAKAKVAKVATKTAAAEKVPAKR
ncbi:hypothetical protein MKL09_19740 [Methylobacterium sp. J-048]|uniref:hypothetical protein n=1 Tax=Methylobacterium sp. J-048 TaxID=2836635 RepID=UPI001FB8CF8B|nr:hypothetical protein [Methylobacterium sp. J-048]MCJ2058769.1 hypothetical protein [Methylobacterium sp. J-048]